MQQQLHLHISSVAKPKTANGMVVLKANGQEFRIGEVFYSLLMQHQKVALEWLLEQHVMGYGSILADEMGLGKTISTISLLAAIF